MDVRRGADGRLLPGHAVLNPRGRPRGLATIEQVREKYGHRVPELIENLFELTRTGSESTKLAANKELLDRIIGKSMQTVETVSAKFDVGAMYLQALRRANGEAAKVVEGKANGIATP
jgi:K+-sensing histidine kinase KdpD